MMEVSAEADTVEELFAGLERTGVLSRVDPDVTPTMYRCATVTRGRARPAAPSRATSSASVGSSGSNPHRDRARWWHDPDRARRPPRGLQRGWPRQAAGAVPVFDDEPDHAADRPHVPASVQRGVHRSRRSGLRRSPTSRTSSAPSCPTPTAITDWIRDHPGEHAQRDPVAHRTPTWQRGWPRARLDGFTGLGRYGNAEGRKLHDRISGHSPEVRKAQPAGWSPPPEGAVANLQRLLADADRSVTASAGADDQLTRDRVKLPTFVLTGCDVRPPLDRFPANRCAVCEPGERGVVRHRTGSQPDDRLLVSWRE